VASLPERVAALEAEVTALKALAHAPGSPLSA